MGTRSLTVMMGHDENEIAVLYRQFAGYPTGHGQDLKEFLDGMAIVNGIGSATPEKAANGMDCLAAQLVAHFKDGIGRFYLHPAGTRDCSEEYIYTVYPIPPTHGEAESRRSPWATVGLKVEKVFGGGKVLYEGPVEDFKPEEVE